MSSYGVGIVGYGGFGQFLHHWWQNLEGIEVVAVSDTRVSPKGMSVRFYSDPTDLFADPRVDIVSIATPPSTHMLLGKQAMEHGKAVIIEKPIALNTAHVEDLFAMRDQQGLILSTNYMLRFNPLIEALREITLNRVLGELLHVGVRNLAQDTSLPSGHWFWNKDISGGILVEHAVHFFDLVHFLSGQQAVHVEAFAAHRNGRQEDRVSCVILHKNGLIANHYHAFVRPGFFEQTSIHLAYDLGHIDLFGWIPLSGQIDCLVNQSSRAAVLELPGATVHSDVPVAKLPNDSRPEGWGGLSPAGRHTKVGGRKYNTDSLIKMSFRLDKSKGAVYGQCVQRCLADLVRKMRNPGHAMRISDLDIYESIRIAEMASGGLRTV